MGPGFTRAFREELARVEEKQSCCRLAAAAGLMHTAGSFLIRGGSTESERYEIRIATTTQSGAKLAYSVFKGYGAEGELLTRREPRFQHRLVYEVHLKGTPAALQALNEMGVLSDTFELQPGISRRLVKKSCCRSAFLRGCLIGAGSANAPQREAHLEILTPHETFADDLVRLLGTLEFHPGMRYRRGSYVVYLKGRDDVAGLLALAGAHEAALQVEEQSVVREVRSRANRLANCDSANLRRTSAAASQQLEAIAVLQRIGSPADASRRAEGDGRPASAVPVSEPDRVGGGRRRGAHPIGCQPPTAPPRGSRGTGGRKGLCQYAGGHRTRSAHEVTGDSRPQKESSSMSTKIAINGFGRIGRLVLRAIAKQRSRPRGSGGQRPHRRGHPRPPPQVRQRARGVAGRGIAYRGQHRLRG